jgi:hypothetical protein
MGCGDPGSRQALAEAFADRGAAYFVGWDNSVSAQFTDTSTASVLSGLAQGKTVQEAVATATNPDPVYHGRLGFVERSAIVQQQLNQFLRELADVSAIVIILTVGPLTAFLVPKLLSGSYRR